MSIGLTQITIHLVRNYLCHALRCVLVLTRVAIFALSLAAMSAKAFATLTSITLEWNPSIDPVLGYKVYFGDVTGTDVTPLQFGNQVSAQIDRLIPGHTYFFYVTAVADSGLESPASDALIYTLPPNSGDGTTGGGGTGMPTITRAPSEQTVTVGSRLELSVEALGQQPLAYQWLRNGRLIADAVAAVLFIPSATLDDAGIYSVLVGNTVGNVQSSPVQITVTPKLPSNTEPLVTSIQPTNTDWNTPITVHFAVTDAESPPDVIQVRSEISDTTLVNSATIQLVRSGSNYALTLAPIPGKTGRETVTILAIDPEEAFGTVSFNLDVAEPLAITVPSSLLVQENSSSAATLIQITAPASSIDDVTLTAESQNTDLIPSGSVLFGGGGSTRYMVVVPSADKFGTTTMLVRASHGNREVIQEIQVTVEPINKPPIITGLPAQLRIAGGQKQIIPFQVEDSDGSAPLVLLQANPPGFSAITSVQGVSLDLSLVLEPKLEDAGSFTLTLSAQDPRGFVSFWQTEVEIIRPALRIERTTNGILMAWPNLDGLSLEVRPATTNLWAPVLETPIIDGAEFKLIVPVLPQGQFYRISITPTGTSTSKS